MIVNSGREAVIFNSIRTANGAHPKIMDVEGGKVIKDENNAASSGTRPNTSRKSGK